MISVDIFVDKLLCTSLLDREFLWKSSRSKLLMDMASSNSTMDPNLWGRLQQYIDLEAVYLRLPLWSFFQLRGVCKEWNTLAQQRRCFTERVQKPYFVIVYPVSCSGEPYHVGILTLQIASGQWRWKRLPVEIPIATQLNPDFVPFSVNGLVFHSFRHWVHDIYDIHTKQTYNVVRVTEMLEAPRVVAMAVDTSATPDEFKTIIGGLDIDTSIDSHSFRVWAWSPQKIRPSRIPAGITDQTWPTCMKSCVQWGDCVYSWWQTDTIQVYSLKEDKWTTLKPPENDDGVGGALGCWDNRLFVALGYGELSVSVWELVDESRQAWRPFARIPGKMYSWLVASAPKSILASFCDRYVLMYTLLGRNDDRKGMSDHFVLFDLATKQWEKTSLWNNTQSNSDDTRRLGQHVGTSSQS